MADGSKTPTTTSVRLLGGGRIELGDLLVRPAAPLAARLIDDAGRPAPGVLVEVVRVGDVAAESVIGTESQPAIPGWPAPTRTDADGWFEIPGLGKAENVWVRLADPRYGIDTLPVGASGVLRVVTARSVEFAVTAADTGEPLPHARVTLLTEQLRSHPYFCVADAAVLSAGTAPPEEFDLIADTNGRLRVGLAPGTPVEVLVHPPEGRSLIGVRRTLVPGSTGGTDIHPVRLPTGRWVEGVVLDADTGSPVAGAIVHWGRADADRPEWRDEFLVGRDSFTRTGPDGTFRVAVLPGPRSLRVHGPSLNFLPVPLALPGTRGTTLYAHAVEHIDVTETDGGSRLTVRLRKGETRAGCVEPETDVVAGKPVILCSGRVSPVRGYASLPLPVVAGRFELPGCEPGGTTRAYLHDPVNRVGAVFDVPPTSADNEPLVVRPEACGGARLRVIDTTGGPVPGCEVVVSLLLTRDRPPGSDLPAAADPQPADWFDPVNYSRRPVTGSDGVTDLPALIPGADYVASVLTPNGRLRVGPFRATTGTVLDLPVVVMPVRPAPGDEFSHRMRAR